MQRESKTTKLVLSISGDRSLSAAAIIFSVAHTPVHLQRITANEAQKNVSN